MRWKPLTLDFLMEKHGLSHTGFQMLLVGWIVIIGISLTSALSVGRWDGSWEAYISTISTIDVILMHLPVFLGIMLVFWLGFEWGFIPVFLSSVMVALGSTMPVQWALLYGFSFILGLAIYALAYYSVHADIRLRSLKSIAFYIVVSVIASIASSLGSFIWSDFFNLSTSQAMITWKRWWTGMFFQSVFLIGPLLYLFSTRIEQLKQKYFETPPSPAVSINWIYGTIGSVAIVLIVFILSAKTLGTGNLVEQYSTLPASLLQDLRGANESFAMVTWISIGLVLVTSATGVYLLGTWNRRLKEKVDEQTIALSQKEKMLRDAIEDRDDLLDEIHDRMRNNLTIVLALLELQLKNREEKSIDEILRDSHSRIRSMAVIHETMAGTHSVSRVNLKNYAFKLSNKLRQSYRHDNKDIEMIIKADDFLIDIDRAFPFAMILNELLVNAYDHAFNEQESGSIYVEIKAKEEHIDLRVRDTGKGLPDDFNEIEKRTLGIKLVRTLTKQLNAEFKIEDYQKTCFLIRIPDYTESLVPE